MLHGWTSIDLYSRQRQRLECDGHFSDIFAQGFASILLFR